MISTLMTSITLQTSVGLIRTLKKRDLSGRKNTIEITMVELFALIMTLLVKVVILMDTLLMNVIFSGEMKLKNHIVTIN